VDDCTGWLGTGDVGRGGGTSATDKSSDDLDTDDEVISRHLLGLPVTKTGDNSGVPTSTTINYRWQRLENLFD